MFEHLQKKWKVRPLQLLLIIATFALGGSACGYIGRVILKQFDIESKILWITLYLLLITILWPLCVLLISIPLGQFLFFKKYVGKILAKFKNKK